MTRHMVLKSVLALTLAGGLCTTANAQSAFYTFTSGPGGDGITWPASPTGLLDGDSFITPDENINIENFSNNNTFFDSQYQAAGNSPAISGDAWWGNPLDTGFPEVGVSFINTPNGTVDTISFDFAWAIAGMDADTSLEIFFDDGQGAFAFENYPLFDSFNAGGAFGGFDGASGHIDIDVADLFDPELGDPLQGIESMLINLSGIDTLGGTGEFAIDNLQIDGGTGGGNGSTVFPSVNNGAVDVSGSTLGSNVLRGTGTHSQGVEVTNNSGIATTFSTVLVPGGALADGGQVSGDAISDGQTIFNPGLVTLDRSLPTGTYESDITIINDGDPADPDDTVTISVKIHDAPSLSGNFPGVNVSAAQTIDLSNAAAAVNGFRASVKVTGTTITGPFAVQGYDNDTPVKPGETLQGTASFNRFGQLSGNHVGSFTASLQMTAFTGVNNDFEVFLADAEPVPDQQWTLNFNLPDTVTDTLVVAPGEDFGPSKIGVNDADTAATLIDGTSSSAQTIDMDIVPNPDPFAFVFLVGDPVDLSFSTGPDLFVFEFTFDAVDLPPGLPPQDLIVLEFNTTSTDFDSAIIGNLDAGAGSDFFPGSYDDFLAGPGGGSLDAGDLSTFGVDTTNNHAWVILDHEGIFGLGTLTPALPGDLDSDGFVGITDLNIVLANWNLNVPPANAQADPSGDGFVGIEDLNIVLGNWNAGTPPSEGSAIPEPGTLAVFVLMSVGMLKRRRAAC